MNQVDYSNMNQGYIVKVNNLVYFGREKEVSGYPIDVIENASKEALEEMGFEFCYSISPYTRENPDQVVFAA